jgi:predicted phosphodiesterase
MMDDPGIINVALSVMKTLPAPIHYVPGNHDILPDKLTATVASYEKNFGPLLSKAECHGVLFLFVYTEPLRKSIPLKGYEPLKWLESTLTEAGDQPVVICTHAASVEDFYGNALHRGWRKEEKARWERLIGSHNVKAVITGHFHRDELHWIGDVPMFVCPPVAGYWERQAVFRIYEYRDGKIGYRTVYMD